VVADIRGVLDVRDGVHPSLALYECG
jgi:hypothetical protein